MIDSHLTILTCARWQGRAAAKKRPPEGSRIEAGATVA